MKKKINKKQLLLTSIIILLPVVAGLFLYNQMPDNIAIHWGVDNKPNGFAPKLLAIVGMPIFLWLINLLVIFMVNVDPKNANQNKKIQWLGPWIVAIIAFVVQVMTILAAIGKPVNVGMMVTIIIGFTYMVVGNYLPKATRNYTIGIRLPWTLDNEDNWRSTHRLAGYIWSVGGLLVVISGIFMMIVPALVIFFTILAITLLMIIIPLIYSYRFYKNSRK